MTRVSTLVTAVLVLLAACQATPAPKQEDPDARRMAVMRDEPLAPHSPEPRSDVLPDRPAALEPGKSCIETSIPPEARQESGTSTVMTETSSGSR